MLKILADEYHPTAIDHKKDIEETIKILYPKYIPQKYKWKSLQQWLRKNQQQQEQYNEKHQHIIAKKDQRKRCL